VSHDTLSLNTVPLRDVSSKIIAELTDADDMDGVEDVAKAILLGPSGAILLGARPARIVARDFINGQTTRFGRAGSGPGEFRRPTDVALSGDTVVLLDPSLARLSFFQASTGKLLWSRQIELKRTNSIAGVLPNGSVVLHSAGIFVDRSATPVERALADVTAVPRAGEPVRLLGVPDLFLKSVEARFGERREIVQVPVRLGPTAAVVTTGDKIVATSSERLGFSVYDSNGGLLQQVTVAKALRPVTPRMRSLAMQVEIDALRGSSEPLVDRAEYERRIVRSAPYRDSLPAIHRLLVARSGTIWAVEGIAPGDSGWTAIGFRASGTVTGRIRSRIRGVPLAIDDDRVLTREYDADGSAVLRIRGISRR